MTKPDFMAVLIGPPRHGKSSLAAELAETRLRAGSFVLVQDMNREYERFCVRYPSEDAFLSAVAAATKSGTPMPGGASFAMGADRVLALAVRLGRLWNQEHGSVRQPICFVVNETTSFDESGSTYIGKELARAIAERRHLGLEMIYCMQHAAQLPASTYEYVTEVHVFRQTRRDRCDQIEKTLGLERGTLDGLLSIQPHSFATWRPLVGLV